MEIASEIHPAWHRCSDFAKLLHARNVNQVLGHDLKTPSSFVVYWAIPAGGSCKGGTRTAVELAKKHNIPTYNLYHKEIRDKFEAMIEKYTGDNL